MDRSHHGDTEARGAKLSFRSRPEDATQQPPAEASPLISPQQVAPIRAKAAAAPQEGR